MSRLPDYDRAATLACKALLKLKVTQLPVNPLAILRKCRNTVVYTYQQAAEKLQVEEEDFERKYGDADAFTIRCGQRYVVCFRAGGNPARLNFTLAHELGHILLHHTEDTQTEEAEANCFAGHLLCPEPVIRHRTPESVATTCYVSRTAAETALEKRKGKPDAEVLKKVEKLLKKGIDN